MLHDVDIEASACIHSFHYAYVMLKVTIRPGFPGTVPIFNLKSRKKSQVSRDAHLSRFWPGVPDLSQLNKLLRDEHGNR